MIGISENGGARASIKHRVLVVNDEESGRMTTSSMIEEEGDQVETASDGPEGVEKMEG